MLFDDSDTPLLNYSVSDGIILFVLLFNFPFPLFSLLVIFLMLYTGIPWITMPRARNGGGLCVDCHDWYFFGYGLDYTRALYDFSTLSGPIALPPSSAFGGWWSRYYAYRLPSSYTLFLSFQSFQSISYLTSYFSSFIAVNLSSYQRLLMDTRTTLFH